MPHIIKNQKGIALIVALMLTLMLTIVGLGIIKSSNDEVAIAGNDLNEMRAFYAAEAGLEKATAWIQAYYESTGAPPASYPAETLLYNNINVGYRTVAETPASKTITKTALVGLKAYARPHFIESTAFDSSHSTAVTLEQHFEVAFVPIFQFGVFYNNDLEISPATAMPVFKRVHSNANIYVQSTQPLQFGTYVTARGNIYHGPKGTSGLSVTTGDIQFTNSGGAYSSMKMGSDWLDAGDAFWFDSATTRWGGKVQDASFAVEELRIALASSADLPHELIERATAGGGNPNSYENSAPFKIINGQALYDVGSGTWTNVTAALQAAGAMAEVTFHDKREGTDITVVDLKLGLFKLTAYRPANGIIYFSDNRSGLHGIRVINAADIGYATTVVSENPVYTKGSINTTTKKPMAIICDALTVLSSNWNDAAAQAASANVSDRPAINTAVNFCFIAGDRETGAGGSTYNGGMENLIRLLEDWNGKTLTFRGSMVSLWRSQQAVANWGTAYFNAPTRDWAYDVNLDSLPAIPPATPNVRAFFRWGWKQANVLYTPTDFGAVVPTD
jgi:hypothetical protein